MDGSSGSILLIRLYHSDRFHQVFVLLVVFALMNCFVADRLIGSGLCRSLGSKCWLLDPYSAASLASLSAASLPSDPLCPATQLSVISNFVRSAGMNRAGCGSALPCMLTIPCLIMLTRCYRTVI